MELESPGSQPSSGPSSQDDQPVQHFSTKHRVIAWISQNLFDHVTYTVRHGLLKGMRRRGGLGFLPEFLGGSQTKEARFWQNLDLRGKTVYDIGAFEGILTLFFARQAAAVVSYEPNSRNRERLTENVRLNALHNVTIRPVGIGSEPQTLTLVWDALTPGGAAIQPAAAGRPPGPVTRLQQEQIQITTLDQDRAASALPAPDFVKIDIEGFEIDALLGARETLSRHRPELFLEMHGETVNEKRRKVREIVDFLRAAGYENIVHVETATPIAAENSSVAARGHLYCRHTGSH